jgi:hypothetical protein
VACQRTAGRRGKFAQCKRPTQEGTDYCWQHRGIKYVRNWGAIKVRGGSVKALYTHSKSAFDALNRMADESQISKSGIIEALIEGAALRRARFVKTAPGIIREAPPLRAHDLALGPKK